MHKRGKKKTRKDVDDKKKKKMDGFIRRGSFIAGKGQVYTVQKLFERADK
jgi:hypothetical protein